MQQLESWPTDTLIEYARNPRKNDHAVDRVAAAIREFGFRVPILAKSDKTIVDGHLRLKAAKKLGLEEVPVLLCDDMTDIQVRAFRLSVNKVSEFADWDDEMLRVELDALGTDGFDIELTGFSLDEIADLQIEEVPDGLTDEDAQKCGARGGHYNDGELKETETLKLAYRVESFLAIDRVKAIELFAGQGALTSWYKRSFENVVSNDIQVFESVTHAHNLSASAFIKKELPKHLDFDFIDFDDEGCPAKELQEFFKIIKHKKEPFVLAITDGQGLNLKCHGRINFKRTYMIREDATVKAKTEDYYNFTEIFREFMSIVTQGFNYKELSLYLKDNGNVIYATYLIEKV